MPIHFIHSFITWFLKKRVHQIELFVKYPNEVQQELLLKLVHQARNTELGKKYGFKAINSYKGFSEQVPVCTYEDIAPLIDRTRKGEQNIFWHSPIRWFAKSSGTSNAKSKFIPISNESLEDCHYKGGKDMLSLYLNNNPNSKLLSGKGLRLGGSHALYEDNNSYFGDLSAILIENMPFWAELASTPSQRVSLMSEWESKIQAIVQESLHKDVTSLTGVPSWMLVLLQHVHEKTNAPNILSHWPNLEVYFHGGVNFEPYKNEYQKLLPSSTFNYYEIYNASEGFFGIQDQNNSNEMMLMLDYGVFYEFIPMDTFGTPQEKVIPLWEIMLHQNYAVLITTNAGLWRYNIGDTIRFTSSHPYRFKITGRTKNFINVFGEELMIENAERALSEVCLKHNLNIVDFTAGPIFMKDSNKGGHEWMVEFKTPPKDLDDFAKDLDNNLQTLNSDYEAKRKNNITLLPLKLHIAQEGLFYKWLKSKKKIGGQHKVPRLSNTRDLLDELIELNT